MVQLIEHLEEFLILDPLAIDFGDFWFPRFSFAEVEELIEFKIQRFRPLLNSFNGGNRVPAFNPGYVAPYARAPTTSCGRGTAGRSVPTQSST